jgi:hypothetical protein
MLHHFHHSDAHMPFHHSVQRQGITAGDDGEVFESIVVHFQPILLLQLIRAERFEISCNGL